MVCRVTLCQIFNPYSFLFKDLENKEESFSVMASWSFKFSTFYIIVNYV